MSLQQGILNPGILSLLARTRHTNSLVIADCDFPSWPGLETVDVSLTRGFPTVLQVLKIILPNWQCGAAFMAGEFLKQNDKRTRAAFVKMCRGVELQFEPHADFKKRVPQAVGIIRTGDTTKYGNIILVSS
jgi:D-ribose pyranase